MKNDKNTILYVAFALLCAFSAHIASVIDRPNILFIVSDDHGWGDLPANGQDRSEIDDAGRIGFGGVRLPNSHTEPLWPVSRLHVYPVDTPWKTACHAPPGNEDLARQDIGRIERDVKLLSQHLAEVGYATGAFGKWHMGSLEGEVPNDRGFDEFRGFLGGAHPYWVTARSKMMHNREPDRSEGHATELFTQWAEDFIRTSVDTDKPFFCYLAYNAVHGPLRTEESQKASAPDAWVNKAIDRGVSFLRSDYVAILEHMDHNIGRLVDLLSDLDVAENTLIVFVSDNGACTMGDDTAGNYPGNNGPFRGGKATTYQGGLSVPLVMNWKGRLPQGMASVAQVMHCDVFSTLLDAAGAPVPEMNGENPVRGMSLMPHMLSAGNETIPERTMIFELWGNIGLRKGRYKLWSKIESNHADWKEHVAELGRTDLELFDLSQDIAEQNDLRMQLPEVYTSLKKELVDYFANINAEYTAADKTELWHEESPDPKTSAPAQAPNRRSQDLFFKNRDRNGDEIVTLEEFIGNPKGRNIPALTRRFKQLDSNKDGKLLLDELLKATR